MKKLKLFFILLLLLVPSMIIKAQDGKNESAVGKFMRSNERSYVVIAVMVTILIGLILYVVRLDRKISKLEKEK
jgi:hypothetical protein